MIENYILRFSKSKGIIETVQLCYNFLRDIPNIKLCWKWGYHEYKWSLFLGQIAGWYCNLGIYNSKFLSLDCVHVFVGSGFETGLTNITGLIVIYAAKKQNLMNNLLCFI